MKRSTTMTLQPQYFFQIVTKTAGEIVAIHFSASSKEDRDEWLATLSTYCRCCEVCDSLVVSPYHRFRTATDSYRKITTVSVSVRSARDLPTVDVIRGKCDPYCIVQLNEIDFARTFTKWHTNHPVWEENFIFE